MLLYALCVSVSIIWCVHAQSTPNANFTHERYLHWLYTNFRGEFWISGVPSRQFAVVTVERLTQHPNVNPDFLPLYFPTDWNAAFYAHTAPDHTEPVLFEQMRSMILDFLQETNRLPRDIYLYTFNIPCPECTTTILDHIRIHIPETIRQFIRENPQYNNALPHINDIHYRFGWTIERGNRAYTRATLEEFADTNDSPFEPSLTFYPRIRLNPAFACNLISGRKKRNTFGSTLDLTSDWYSLPKKWKHVSAGVGGVWGVDTTGAVFYKGNTYEDSLYKGNDWERIPGPFIMKQLAVGNNTVWAVTDSGRIHIRFGIEYKRPKGDFWDIIPGSLQQISACSQERVWGVNVNGMVFRRNHAQNKWIHVTGSNKFKQVTVGSGGVWGILSNGEVQYREGTFGDKDTSGTAWTIVGGTTFNHIDSADGMVWGVDTNDKVYYRLGQTSANPKGTAWISLAGSLKQISVSNRAVWGVSGNSVAMARLSTFGFDLKNWELIPGVSKHISTGFAGVWSIDIGGNIHYRQSTYAAECNSKGSGEWESVYGNLKQLDVGHRVVWGVNTGDTVYVRQGITLVRQTGTHWEAVKSQKLRHVSVSPAGHVWGVDGIGTIYRRVGAKNKTPVGDSWKQIPGQLVQISVGKAGVWGVNVNNDVYYRYGTTGDVDTDGSGWTKVDTAAMKYISSGPGCVRALDQDDNVYYRSGMSASNPTGSNWVKPDLMQLQQIEIYDHVGGIWGVSSAGQIFARKF